MGKLFAIVALAAVSCGSPGLAQVGDASTPPSNTARELARAWGSEQLPGLLNALPSDATVIEQGLLTSHYAPRGAACDPSHSECRRAAREVAQEAAEANRALKRRISGLALARFFDTTMTEAQMQETTAFLSTPVGQAFARSVTTVPYQQYVLALSELEPSGELNLPDQSTYHKQFYDLTESLPRAPSRLIRLPPPPVSRPPETRD